MSLDITLYMEINTGGDTLRSVILFDANITHNLGKMADAAGLYPCLWRPHSCGHTLAKDIIPELTRGYNKLKDNPLEFKEYDNPCGWGTYDTFLPWVREYLDACNEHPLASIDVDI